MTQTQSKVLIIWMIIVSSEISLVKGAWTDIDLKKHCSDGSQNIEVQEYDKLFQEKDKQSSDEVKTVFLADTIVYKNKYLVKRVYIGDDNSYKTISKEISFWQQLDDLVHVINIPQCKLTSEYLYLIFLHVIRDLNDPSLRTIIYNLHFRGKLELFKKMADTLLQIHKVGVYGVGFQMNGLLFLDDKYTDIIFGDFSKAIFHEGFEFQENALRSDFFNLIYSFNYIMFLPADWFDANLDKREKMNLNLL
jgi:hypothetical protein